MSSRVPRSSAGFTMIELLVVVAILVTLAAAAYPLMLSFIDSGKLTKCEANVTQLLSLGQKYGTDFAHRDMRPVSGMADDTDTFMDEGEGWWISIAPELVDTEMPTAAGERLILPGIFHCPSDLRAQIDDERGFEASPKTVSYVSWTDNSEDDTAKTSSIKLRQQNYDILPWLSDGIPQPHASVQDFGSFRKMVYSARNRHKGKIVVGYVSGAVKIFDLTDYNTPQDAYKRIAPTFPGNESSSKKSKKRRH